PLGMPVFDQGIQASLFGAIMFHKLPEAMLIASVLLYQKYSKAKTFLLFAFFCLITPVAALITHYLGASNSSFKEVLNWLLPVIAGSFLHIATTIFFESGTKKHQMNLKNWVAIFLGIGIALISTLFSSHQH